MRVSEVSLSAGDSRILNFSLNKPRDDDRYYIRTMIGMDADEIVSRFNRFGLYSGQPLVTQTIVDRTIVLRVVLNPEWRLSEDYSTLRDHIYRGISKSRSGTVTVRLMDTGVSVAEIEGVITKVEVPIFSSTPELQVTIKCPDAMLVAPNYQDIDPSIFVSASAGEHFAGSVTDTQSTAPHGLVMSAELTGAAKSAFYIQDNDPSNVSPEWHFRIEYPFLTNDVLTVDTQTRLRAAYITRGAQRIDLMHSITLDSIWPLIYPGRNPIAIAFTDNVTHDDWTLLDFHHHATYWGI